MLRRLIKSFGYAFAGVQYAFRTQFNFKFHILALFAIIIAGWHFELTTNQWLWLIIASGLVIISELFNTAIEVLVDLASPSFHEKAKVIKDVAAAAVLMAAIVASVIGLIIFIPKFF